MLNLKTLGRVVIAGAVLLSFLVINSDNATARPGYKKPFEAAYPDLVKKHGKDGKSLSCAVCHPVKDKKKRNDYGVALTKALGKKNEKDKDKIKEALKKAEKEKNKAGKTFGELIKAGELPGGKDAAN